MEPHDNDEQEPWQQVEQAYAEIQRRDGQAEYRAWHWQRFALALLGVWVVTMGVVVWQLIRAQRVQAFVQTVQLSESGALIQLGLPQDLLAYTPQEGVWLDMLGEWVRKVRWRSTDPTQMRAQWAWAYRHTCPQARQMLQGVEDREQPFKSGSKRLTAVELKSITKTPTPESYQVLWVETTTEPSVPGVKSTLWAGTFSVGRLRPANLTDAMDNRLGLCVTAFDLSQQATEGK